MQYLDGKTTVTHIIASSLTPKKRIEFRRYRIVKPAWVVESVKAGRLLPWDAFRVIDEGKGQKVLGLDDGKVVNQANNQQRGYRDQTDTSWYTSQVQELAKELSNELDVANSQLSSEHAASQHQRSHIGGRPSQGSQAPNNDSTDLLVSPVDEATLETAADGAFQPLSNPSGPARMPQDPNVDQNDVSIPMPSRPILDDDEAHPSHKNQVTDQAGVLSGLPSPNTMKGTNSSDGSPAAKRSKLTAEEHNTILLADPHIRKSSVVNPDFLKQYYSESRLHHLSAWKASLKAQMQQLTDEKSASQKAVQKRPPGARRYIMHVDFDSFFAAVSLKNAPQYIDKPVAVAHGGGTGSEIASCNYPARAFGVKNGMWMKNAQQLCPELKVLPYDFKAYEEASREFYEAIIATGGIVQSVSVDEALVDITMSCLPAGGTDGRGVREGSIWREQAKADEIARNLRNAIKEKTGCAVSVGIGGNILLAKVALRKAKPAGQHQIKPEEVLDFIGELTVQDLPGVAYSIGGKLEEIGIKFVKDIRGLTKERLISVLGPKTGEKIWDYSRGIDRTEVGEQVIRKSVSAEVNWGVRFETQEQADDFVCSLCEELHNRLVEQRVRGRQITMKIMRRAADAPLDPPKHLGHGKCDTFNKSVLLGVPTNSKEILSREALSILKGWGFSPGELRGLGVQMTKLEPLKVLNEGQAESSQRRLHFSSKEAARVSRGDTEDPIVDDPETPKKTKPPPIHPAAVVTSIKDDDSGPQKPLNTLGTQFVIPSQLDPEVLKELPQDIRSKLMQGREEARSRAVTPHTDRSRSQSPAIPNDAIPSFSQLDPETLEALPDDVKAELLNMSRKPSVKPSAQSLLPQSPRKVRAIAPSKKGMGQTRKRGGLLFRGRTKNDPTSTTLTQSNFVAKQPRSRSLAADATTSGPDEAPSAISEEFLSALPEDIRREVLAQHRRDRLQQRGHLNVSATASRRAQQQQQKEQTVPAGQRRLRLPPRPPKPAFTTRKLTSLPDLRDVLSAWVDEFAQEGPYEEDVAALAKYLGRVVGEEGDLAKAVAGAKWLAWVIQEKGGDERDRRVDAESEADRGMREWRKALNIVQDAVQDAVKARGLGKVAFD